MTPIPHLANSKGFTPRYFGMAELCDRRLKTVRPSDSVSPQCDASPLEVWAVNRVRQCIGLDDIEVKNPLVRHWGNDPRCPSSPQDIASVDIDTDAILALFDELEKKAHGEL